jgi:hypothetical protein
MKARLLVLPLAAMLLAGCNLPLIGVTPTPSPTAAARPRSTATLTLIQPQPNSVVTQTTLHVEFQLTGGRIVQVVSKNLTPDTGHIHLSIDGHVVSMNYKLSEDVSMQPFAPGPHLLQGEFVAVDHAPFNPRVITKAIVEYQPPGSS